MKRRHFLASVSSTCLSVHPFVSAEPLPVSRCESFFELEEEGLFRISPTEKKLVMGVGSKICGVLIEHVSQIQILNQKRRHQETLIAVCLPQVIDVDLSVRMKRNNLGVESINFLENVRFVFLSWNEQFEKLELESMLSSASQFFDESGNEVFLDFCNTYCVDISFPIQKNGSSFTFILHNENEGALIFLNWMDKEKKWVQKYRGSPLEGECPLDGYATIYSVAPDIFCAQENYLMIFRPQYGFYIFHFGSENFSSYGMQISCTGRLRDGSALGNCWVYRSPNLYDFKKSFFEQAAAPADYFLDIFFEKGRFYFLFLGSDKKLKSLFWQKVGDVLQAVPCHYSNFVCGFETQLFIINSFDKSDDQQLLMLDKTVGFSLLSSQSASGGLKWSPCPLELLNHHSVVQNYLSRDPQKKNQLYFSKNIEGLKKNNRSILETKENTYLFQLSEHISSDGRLENAITIGLSASGKVSLYEFEDDVYKLGMGRKSKSHTSKNVCSDGDSFLREVCYFMRFLFWGKQKCLFPDISISLGSLESKPVTENILENADEAIFSLVQNYLLTVHDLKTFFALNVQSDSSKSDSKVEIVNSNLTCIRTGHDILGICARYQRDYSFMSQSDFFNVISKITAMQCRRIAALAACFVAQAIPLDVLKDSCALYDMDFDTTSSYSLSNFRVKFSRKAIEFLLGETLRSPFSFYKKSAILNSVNWGTWWSNVSKKWMYLSDVYRFYATQAMLTLFKEESLLRSVLADCSKIVNDREFATDLPTYEDPHHVLFLPYDSFPPILKVFFEIKALFALQGPSTSVFEPQQKIFEDVVWCISDLDLTAKEKSLLTTLVFRLFPQEILPYCNPEAFLHGLLDIKYPAFKVCAFYSEQNILRTVPIEAMDSLTPFHSFLRFPFANLNLKSPLMPYRTLDIEWVNI